MSPLDMIDYDSTAETLKHIRKVQANLGRFARLLLERGEVHDDSKLGPDEKPFFDEYTPKLSAVTYGSDEYREMLAGLKPALDHHNAANSHHPEHYENGIDGFDLVDLVEMLCDWKAATERHDDGDIGRSLEINKDRFAMSPQLVSILRNTVERLGWSHNGCNKRRRSRPSRRRT
jgi:hypothetical protein